MRSTLRLQANTGLNCLHRAAAADRLLPRVCCSTNRCLTLHAHAFWTGTHCTRSLLSKRILPHGGCCNSKIRFVFISQSKGHREEAAGTRTKGQDNTLSITQGTTQKYVDTQGNVGFERTYCSSDSKVTQSTR